MNNLIEQALFCGFDVYIASAGHYGFYTDGARVVSFQCERGRGLNVSGNYIASRQCGTGWQIMADVDDSTVTADNVRAWLATSAPMWTNPKPVYTTCEQHLATYGTSSKYRKI